jgi:hypothetical protein
LIANESKTDELHSDEILDDDNEKFKLLQNELETTKSQLKILKSKLAEKERRAKKLSIPIEIDDDLTEDFLALFFEKDAFKTVELNGEIIEYREASNSVMVSLNFFCVRK